MTDPAHPFTNADRGERLQRVLADAGIGSRRACEAMIEQGDVEVNGVLVCELPAWVDPDEDRIVVQGRPLPKPERKTYLLLNKPPRTLSTLKDEPGADRRTVAELVDHPLVSHLFPVGRLDYDTVGLVLMTNDGDLANKLTHPRYGVPKTYRVLVKGSLDAAAIADLERGIYLAERKAGQTVGAKRTSSVEIELVHQDRNGTVLDLTLREGRNRQVRRMLAAVGYPVRKLERIGMGPVRLKGVARGAWRELTRDEVWALRRAAAGGGADGGASKGGKPGTASRGDKNSRYPKKGAAKAGPKAGTRAGPRTGIGRPGPAPAMEEGEGVATPKIRRRTMKNAINRAANPGTRPARPRTEDEGGTEGAAPKKPAEKKTVSKTNKPQGSDRRGPKKPNPPRDRR